MFRALCAYHQEIRIVLYGIWYHHTSPLSTCAQDGHLQSVMTPDALQYNSDLLMMST